MPKDSRKPCTPCRYRKVKCDRIQPECGRCARGRRRLECTYVEDLVIQPTDRYKLPKGRACTPCRRKKKKCNATRPYCGSCESVGAGMKCFYQDTLAIDPQFQQPSRIGPFYPGPKYEIESVSERPTSLSFYAVQRRMDAIRISQWIQSIFRDMMGSPIHVLPTPRIITFPAHLNINYKPLIRLPPLLFNDQHASALSSVSLEDMNMTLLTYVLFRHRIGFFLPFQKLQAMVLGDMSNKYIHPFFVLYSTAVGCQYYQNIRGNWIYFYRLAASSQKVWEELRRMREQDDPFQYAQAYHLICCSVQNLGIHYTSKLYLQKAVDTIKRHNIRFAPIPRSDVASGLLSSRLEYSQEAHERVVILGKLVHMEAISIIVTGDQERVCSDLEHQFRYEFPRAYPVIFKGCPTILRTYSLLLFKDVSNLLISQNVSRYDVALSSLTTHIDNLACRWTELAEISDHEGCVSVQYSMIICLVAQAEMYYCLDKVSMSPPGVTFQIQCEKILSKLVNVTKRLEHDDFMFLDQFVNFFWARGISLLLDLQVVIMSGPPTPVNYQRLDAVACMIFELKERLHAQRTSNFCCALAARGTAINSSRR